MSVKVKSWKALHTSGTKFYHVITMTDDYSSMAFHHWGPQPLYSAPFSIALGQNKFETFQASTNSAGLDKIAVKQKGGYLNEVDVHEKEFHTEQEFEEFLKSHAHGDCKRSLAYVDKFRWKSLAEVFGSSGLPFPAEDNQATDYSAENESWGTW